MSQTRRARRVKPETVRDVIEAADEFRALCARILRETPAEGAHHQQARHAMEAVDLLAHGLLHERENRHLRSYALH